MASEVDWRAALRAEVNALPTAQSASRVDAIPVELDFLPGAYGAVVAAARLRRLSPAAFARRSALAMAAHELEIPLMDLVQRDPRMTRDTGVAMPDPEMRRFGLWEIERLTGEPT